MCRRILIVLPEKETLLSEKLRSKLYVFVTVCSIVPYKAVLRADEASNARSTKQIIA